MCVCLVVVVVVDIFLWCVVLLLMLFFSGVCCCSYHMVCVLMFFFLLLLFFFFFLCVLLFLWEVLGLQGGGRRDFGFLGVTGFLTQRCLGFATRALLSCPGSNFLRWLRACLDPRLVARYQPGCFPIGTPFSLISRSPRRRPASQPFFHRHTHATAISNQPGDSAFALCRETGASLDVRELAPTENSSRNKVTLGIDSGAHCDRREYCDRPPWEPGAPKEDEGLPRASGERPRNETRRS